MNPALPTCPQCRGLVLPDGRCVNGCLIPSGCASTSSSGLVCLRPQSDPIHAVIGWRGHDYVPSPPGPAQQPEPPVFNAEEDAYLAGVEAWQPEPATQGEVVDDDDAIDSELATLRELADKLRAEKAQLRAQLAALREALADIRREAQHCLINDSAVLNIEAMCNEALAKGTP